MKKSILSVAVIGAMFFSAQVSRGAPVVFEASGANAAAIQASVDSFRAALGTLNANQPTVFPNGRREINWDGVPDASSSPNAFPGNFFNGNVAGRARGVLFTTPGSGFQVSSNAASGVPVRFGNISANYTTDFGTFSPERLFTPLGNNITDISFFLPSDQVTPAVTSGFGIVFTDVDTAEATHVEFFDAANNLLASRNVLSASGNGTLSFLGISFDAGEDVSRVRVTTGTQPIDGDVSDAVVMDDFIYGEPRLVPEPATWLLALVGGASLLLMARRRRRV